MTTLKEITFENLDDKLVVDIRDNATFRQGHLPNSLNITNQLKAKYWDGLVKNNQHLVLLTEKPESLLAFEDIAYIGYILFDNIPKDVLVTSAEISAEDFLKLNDDHVLLDLRHPDEITRPAPGKNAVNIPLEQLADNLNRLTANKDIYLLCGSGARATAADAYLQAHGFTQTHVIEGGIKAIMQVENK